jgi:hypothetical protein
VTVVELFPKEPSEETLLPILEPPMGFETGFRLLLSGYCPYCGFRVSALGASKKYGLTWCCLNGCNP